MVGKKGQRSITIGLSVFAVFIIAIGAVALLRMVNPAKNDPYVQDDTSSAAQPAETQESAVMDEADVGAPDGEPTSTIDPESVSTVDITPMGIKVSYVKGVGGFEYEVLRASGGTRYVELRSPTLVGTKCTNDAGTFASIIDSPSENERAVLAATTTVEGTVYGLSLAESTCTSDADSLAAYQKSFQDAFTLLEKI